MVGGQFLLVVPGSERAETGSIGLMIQEGVETYHSVISEMSHDAGMITDQCGPLHPEVTVVGTNTAGAEIGAVTGTSLREEVGQDRQLAAMDGIEARVLEDVILMRKRTCFFQKDMPGMCQKSRSSCWTKLIGAWIIYEATLEMSLMPLTGPLSPM